MKEHDLLTFFARKKVYFLLIVFGLTAKILLLPVRTGDFVGFLQPWLNFIQSHGYFSSLKYGFYDYTPAYIYILILIAKIGLNPLFCIKITSIFFEYIAAFFVGKIAGLKFKTLPMVWIAMAIVPLLPTVLLNSSYLSQCDSIYAAFVLGSIYFLFIQKQLLSVLMLGIAFSFKMQFVMLLPFYFVMLLRGNIRWYYFLMVPAVFIFSLLPAYVMGRPLSGLLNVYLSQADHYHFLTLNFPNIYIFFDNAFYQPIKIAGMIITFVLTFVFGIILSRKKYQFSFDQWVRLVFLSAIVIPFLLPGMHERYMYLGDISGVLYWFVLRKKPLIPLGIWLISFYSYIRCSRFNDVLPMEPAFVLYIAVIIFTVFDFIQHLENESKIIYKK
jgi:Gpi18-like mannosyltransferase